MPFGVCKMCLQEKNLVSSHLVPRKIYEYCNKEGHNPIVLTDDVLMASDRQWQYPLLCTDCENVLNDGGEDWCVTKLATFEKTFPLYDLVSTKPPVFSVDKTNIFLVRDIPSVKVKELVHFGMGMFFKAAVHGWKKGATEPRINLEPYTESLRLWLRGEGKFPSDMYLTANITSPDQAQISLFPPYEANSRVFYVYVPGLLFMLDVGPDVKEAKKPLCLWNNPDRPILSSGVLLEKFTTHANEKILSAKQTHSFLNAMEKIAKEKGEKFKN
ncbi:MAG: hypothetical protein WAL60_20150 [Candidatus Sulfotelmatobacter sp.]